MKQNLKGSDSKPKNQKNLKGNAAGSQSQFEITKKGNQQESNGM